MRTTLAILTVILQFLGTHSLIVPDEIPTLLSVIYSNIPTIKKGTDSRIGWGFRLGDRADFQMLTEIGPQLNTQPLANQGDTSTANKRHVANNLRNILYAQHQERKKQISNTDGGTWIEQWSQSMRNVKGTRIPTGIQAKPGLGIGEIDAKSVIPDDSEELGRRRITVVNQQPKDVKSENSMALLLEKLYGGKVEDQQKEEVEVTTQQPKTTTSAKEALDNVDMDDSK